MAAAAAALVFVPASEVQAAGTAPGPVDLVGLDFQVINGHSDKCLADSGDRRTVLQKECERTGAQRWRLAPFVGDASFQIINVGSDKCLASEGGRVVLGACGNADARRWHLRDSKDDSYGQVRNVATGRCLTVAAGSTADGAPAVQDRCDDKKSRRWTVRVVSLPIMTMPSMPLH